jgi:tetratricopeptide (TPR) repeat protein
VNDRSADGARTLRTALVLGVPVALIGWLALVDGDGYGLIARQQLWLAVWWLLALGFAFGVLPRSSPPRAALIAALGALALGALQLASVDWGPSDDRALADACRTVGYLGILALAWAGLGPRSWSSAAAALFAIASVVSVLALLGRLAPEISGLDDPFGAGRLAEPLGYWNALAAWAAATLSMGLAWSADARRSRTRMLAAAIVPVAGTVVYLTYSRGGVLAAALGVAVVITLSRNRPRAAAHALAGAVATGFCVGVVRSQPEIADGGGTEGALLVAICVAAAAGACAFVASRTREVRAAAPKAKPVSRFKLAAVATLVACLAAVAVVAGRDGFGRGGDAAALANEDPAARLTTAAGNRSAYWSEALDAFAAQPLRGEGAGSFGYRWATEGSEPELVTDAHSLPLSVAAELGLLGLIALAAMIGGLILGVVAGTRAAGRNAPAVALAATGATFLLSVAIDWTWESTAIATLALACAGTLSMAAADVRQGRALRRLSGRNLALAGACIVLGAIQVPGVGLNDALRDSRRDLATGQLAGAIASADRAVDAAPWSGAARAVRAEARLEAGDLDAARGDALAAIEREPLEAEDWILLAEIERARGAPARAARALREAVRLSPHEAP